MIDHLIEKLSEQYPDSNHRMTVEDFATWMRKNAAPVVERQEPVAYLIECEYRASTIYSQGTKTERFELSREVSFNSEKRPRSEIVRDVVVSPLYASQPAPVAVMLPPVTPFNVAEVEKQAYPTMAWLVRDLPFETPEQETTRSKVCDLIHWLKGSLDAIRSRDACLDKVKELNQ